MFIRAVAVLAGLAFLGALPVNAQALDKVERVCAASKLKATAKKTMSKLKCEAKAIIKDLPVAETECLDKAEAKFSQSFSKAEEKGGCVSDGDAVAVEAAVDQVVQTEVIRQRTAATCPTLFASCGSCGNGICVWYAAGYATGGQVCARQGSGGASCVNDADCTSPDVCISATAPEEGFYYCATPCL